MNTQNLSEQEIAGMLTNLEQAHKFNEEAKKAYTAQNYRVAAHNYHRCLLYAKAVVQLTSMDFREMARAQLLQKTDQQQNEKENCKAADNPIKPSDDLVVKEEGQGTSTSRNRLDSTTRGQEISNEVKELLTKCYNNLAACLLARESNSNEDYMRAVFYCDNVLREEPDNEKAIFRKGVALMKAQKWERAIEQFGICKNNAQAKQLIIECEHAIEEDRRRRDAEIRANFAKARAAEEAQQAAQDNANNGHGNPPPTMNGHVQHQ